MFSVLELVAQKFYPGREEMTLFETLCRGISNIKVFSKAVKVLKVKTTS